jgi:glycosyltransferase involved in cell wall biosynthesis
VRLLFVTQRYGQDVFGGAEQFCREVSRRLVERGHEVEVLTSCARSYVDWADVYEPGASEIDGVQVHRLRVARPRDNDLFNPLNVRVNAGHRPTPLYLQRAWMDQQGPLLPELPAWIEAQAARFDAAVFFTYLYWSTWAGLPVASGLLPTVLHPLAHDEPPLYLAIYDQLYRYPTAFGFLTQEEAALVARRFRVRRPSITTGIGVDLAAPDRVSPEDVAAFRRRFDVGDGPYLLYVGRLDPHKGSEELFSYFTTYKAQRPGPLRLVVVGEPVRPLPPHPDVTVTGWVDEDVRDVAIAGSFALVQPSYFESFSLILMEAWVHARPALVQGRCDVLDGHARRSGGGLPYRGFAEFAEAVDLLLEDGALAGRLGAAGRRYVEEHFAWDVVLDRYEAFLATVSSRRGAATAR